MGALGNNSLVFVIFIYFFGQLKDWVGQILFVVSCPKGQVEKYVNVESWLQMGANIMANQVKTLIQNYFEKSVVWQFGIWDSSLVVF